MKSKIWALSALGLLLSACAFPQPVSPPTNQDIPMSLSLISSAFTPGQSIPAKYSCTGREISPPLSWSGAPASTRSFALIVDDPDAPGGTWVHWVLFNIPPATSQLPEALPAGGSLSDGTLQGRNSSGNIGYNGPCPPSGIHRYFFHLYALDAALSLAQGANKGELLSAMQGHILAQGELMGTFSR